MASDTRREVQHRIEQEPSIACVRSRALRERTRCSAPIPNGRACVHACVRHAACMRRRHEGGARNDMRACRPHTHTPPRCRMRRLLDATYRIFCPTVVSAVTSPVRRWGRRRPAATHPRPFASLACPVPSHRRAQDGGVDSAGLSRPLGRLPTLPPSPHAAARCEGRRHASSPSSPSSLPSSPRSRPSCLAHAALIPG